MTPLETARNLLNLKKRAATAGEAHAATRALAKHLHRHRLNEADVERAAGQTSYSFVIDTNPLGSWSTTIPLWRRELIASVCDHVSVAYFQERTKRSASGRAHRLHIKLCGRSSDIANVRYLFAWLDAEAVRLCGLELRTTHGLPTAHRRKARQSEKLSWLYGFVMGVRDVFIQARIQAEQEAVREASNDDLDTDKPRDGETAIVLASQALELRRENAKAYMLANIGEHKTKSYRWNAVHLDAFTDGRVRGREIHLGKILEQAK